MREAFRTEDNRRRATVASVTMTAANVNGSVGVVPKSSAAIALATTSDAMLPVAIPISVSRGFFPGRLNCTCAAVAPNAIRMPISCVRWVTE